MYLDKMNQHKDTYGFGEAYMAFDTFDGMVIAMAEADANYSRIQTAIVLAEYDAIVNDRDVSTLNEGVWETLKSWWDAFWRMVGNFFRGIADFFRGLFGKSADTEQRIEKLEKKDTIDNKLANTTITIDMDAITKDVIASNNASIKKAGEKHIADVRNILAKTEERMKQEVAESIEENKNATKVKDVKVKSNIEQTDKVLDETIKDVRKMTETLRLALDELDSDAKPVNAAIDDIIFTNTAVQNFITRGGPGYDGRNNGKPIVITTIRAYHNAKKDKIEILQKAISELETIQVHEKSNLDRVLLTQKSDDPAEVSRYKKKVEGRISYIREMLSTATKTISLIENEYTDTLTKLEATIKALETPPAK